MIDISIIQNLRQIKSLSKNWAIKSFNSVLKDNSGGNKKIPKGDFLESGDYFVVDQGKLLIAGYTNDSSSLVKTRPPYIVFGDHTRSIKFIDFPFAMGADGIKVLNIIDNKVAFPKFIFYYLNTLKIPNTGYNRHYKFLKDIVFPLPPLETQKKIAAILDKADELRRNDKEILEKYDQLAQSVFLEMFGDPYLNSKGWIIIELGELCEIIMGQSPKGESYNVTGQGTPLLNGPTEFGENNPTEKQWTTEPRKLCKPDDILFCVRGATAGRMNFADKEYCIGRGLAAIRSKSSVTNKYIFLLLKAMYNIFQKTSDGSTFINISKDDLYAVKVPKTPVEMQNRFASIIDSIEQQKQLTQQSLQKSEELFLSLLQRAFRPGGWDEMKAGGR